MKRSSGELGGTEIGPPGTILGLERGVFGKWGWRIRVKLLYLYDLSDKLSYGKT